jgi:hypothetical protein
MLASKRHQKPARTGYEEIIAISRICIIGLGLLDVFPIGTTTKQNNSGVYDGQGKNILFIASTCRFLVAL